MFHHIRTTWWKLRPPPILSPYLHSPEFAHQLKGILKVYAQASNRPVEFGCLYGWTTSIIARNIADHNVLYSFDIFQRVPMEQVQMNLKETAAKVVFQKLNIWHWLDGQVNMGPFDFMYIDVNNTELIFREVWRRAYTEIKHGVPILIEGATRMRLNIPHQVVVKENPGLGLLLP